jgi:1-acyl-sn-glycerol-3-phosphate acyltransferase
MASPNRQIVACLFLFLRFAFLTFGPWLMHVLIADVLLSCLLPFAFIFPTTTYHLASTIAESVWRGVQRICEDSNGADIILAGDELPIGESAILVANHIEWTDFYLIQALAIRTGMLGRCRWFAKNALRWIPVLGWGLMVMGMPLVSRKWSEDKEELERLFSGIKKGSWPICKSCLRRIRQYTEMTDFFQGLFLSARERGTGQRSMQKLSVGVKPMESHYLSTLCILVQRDSSLLFNNCARHLM